MSRRRNRPIVELVVTVVHKEDLIVIIRVIMIVIAAWIALQIILWLLGVALGILKTAIIVAVIIGVVYLLYAIFEKQKQTY